MGPTHKNGKKNVQKNGNGVKGEKLPTEGPMKDKKNYEEILADVRGKYPMAEKYLIQLIAMPKMTPPGKELTPEEQKTLNEQLYEAIEKFDSEKTKSLLAKGADPVYLQLIHYLWHEEAHKMLVRGTVGYWRKKTMEMLEEVRTVRAKIEEIMKLRGTYSVPKAESYNKNLFDALEKI